MNSELYEGCDRDPCILGSVKCMSDYHTGTRTRCYHGSVNYIIVKLIVVKETHFSLLLLLMLMLLW